MVTSEIMASIFCFVKNVYTVELELSVENNYFGSPGEESCEDKVQQRVQQHFCVYLESIKRK